MLGIWATPYPIIATASASTMYRNFKLDLTIERITAGYLPVGSLFLELFLAAVQLRRAGRDDHRARRRSRRQHRRLAVDVVHRHGRPDKGERVVRGDVRPGVAFLVVQERRIGNHLAQRPANHDGPQRRGLDVEPLGRLRRHGHPAEIRPVDLLDLDRPALDFLFDRGLRAGRQGQTGDAQSDCNPSIVGLHRFLPSFRPDQAGACIRPPGMSSSSSRTPLTPRRRYSAGTMNRLTNVEVSRPPRRATAIGRTISRPGTSPRNRAGSSASPTATVAVTVATTRSEDPRSTRPEPKDSPPCRSRPW